MTIIDLTHFISPDMPVYPGTEGPKFQPANTYEKDGFKETLLSMYTHTGTHMDPPAHLFPGRTTLDRFPVSQFVGSAVVIDCSDRKEGQLITMDYLERQMDLVEQAEFLLFSTGWEKLWGTEAYFGDYPCVSDEVLTYVMEHRKKGIGLDTIGLDPVADLNLTRHKKLFRETEAVVIENLMNLHLLPRRLFSFFALPLKHIDADGSPIRAIAVLDDAER